APGGRGARADRGRPRPGDPGTPDRDGRARGRAGQPGSGGGAGRGRPPAPRRGPLPRRTGNRAGAGVGIMRRSLPVTLLASGTTSGEGGSEELTGGRHAGR